LKEKPAFVFERKEREKNTTTILFSFFHRHQTKTPPGPTPTSHIPTFSHCFSTISTYTNKKTNLNTIFISFHGSTAINLGSTTVNGITFGQ
jgi:hypothetical protein